MGIIRFQKCYSYSMDKINDVLTKLNDLMYTYLLLILLVGVGLYFTIVTKGVQFRLLREGIRCMLEPSKTGRDGKKRVSSFQALMISTASRVGTGNIAGIATAIAAGGPGSVFWMWLMALIGGASAFAESTLAQVYKVREGGAFRGGPSYYMERGLGRRWMGVLFSVLLILCFAYGFNSLQAYNISSALEYYIEDYSNTGYPILLGLALAAAMGLVIRGGVHRIGFITSVLVPVMALLYILMGLVTVALNMAELPHLLAVIIRDAFDLRAMAGGFAGNAVVIGIKRGLFSNEAGMGSAPNASASADVQHPVKQGLVQVISVFIDTLFICSSTAMMLLMSDIEGKTGALDGIPYVQAAISKNVGPWGIHFITFSIFSFAFSSLIGNYYYAESNFLFIKNSRRGLTLFRMTCLAAVFLGTQADFALVWNLADITMGFMAIVNIIAIFLLRKIVLRVLDHYEKRRKEQKPVVFCEDDIKVAGTVWNREEKGC